MIKAIGRISVAVLWIGTSLHFAEQATSFPVAPNESLVIAALYIFGGAFMAIDVLRNGVE